MDGPARGRPAEEPTGRSGRVALASRACSRAGPSVAVTLGLLGLAILVRGGATCSSIRPPCPSTRMPIGVWPRTS